METLLYGLLLCSGNDAALAVADSCGGQKAFVARMNARAAELGMAHTSFENPNGLDGAAHYSTARDMAALACCAMENPTYRPENRLYQHRGANPGDLHGAGRTPADCGDALRRQ